jgi:hypothetical protein
MYGPSLRSVRKSMYAMSAGGGCGDHGLHGDRRGVVSAEARRDMGDASAGAGVVAQPPAGDPDLATLYKAPLAKQVNTPIRTRKDALKQQPAGGDT